MCWPVSIEWSSAPGVFVDRAGAQIVAGVGRVIAVVKNSDPYFDDLSAEIRGIITAAELDVFNTHVQGLLASLQNGSQAFGQALAVLTNGFRSDLGPEVTDAVLDRLLLGYTRGTVDIVQGTRWEFNRTDERALEWLGKDATYWIGSYHGPEFSTRVAEAMQPAFQQGLAGSRLADHMAQTFGTEFNRSASYWEGFSTNVVTRSRTFGTTEGLVRSGAVEGEFSAVLDGATSGICRAMDGRIIRVPDMVAQRDAILALTDPEAIKTTAPWRTSEEQIGQAVSFADAMGYVPADIQPPLHFHCRSTIIFRR